MGLFATVRHIRRLADVEDRLEALERQMKGLDLEWSDTHQELRTMLGKISKRKKQLEHLQGDAQPSETGVSRESATPENGANLTESQIRAQREILARRRSL